MLTRSPSLLLCFLIALISLFYLGQYNGWEKGMKGSGSCGPAGKSSSFSASISVRESL